ncbi:hypothetical protein KGF54_001104 [Candida jiufengensis]|uniref:uncharacterized protein n=1 Tax=Candida jiufengensis TaxID=497108 RepID=UPI0022256769|nr:uncharacterized protein KGF54_001104 [Candida jiufengensis]KAI5955602.1 hypothetical protein KGF54_001104 [Candida jiufengensis]
MYRNTVTKNLTPTVEDLRLAPPMYTPNTSNSDPDYFASVPGSPEPEMADEEDEETILENAHKLKRLSSTNKDISKSLEVKLYLTKSIGKVGEKYTIIDPLSYEFKQGDFIYGFVLITNRTKVDIPFDMFSVQLEGTATFGKTNSTLVDQPAHISRFLTMFDFNASWNDAFLDRLISDHNNPHSSNPMSTFDPIDNTYYHLNAKKIFEPGITYKKFFTFKIPEKLLDNNCEQSLIKHLQIPPTLGISKNEVISSLRHKWKDQDIQVEDLINKKYKYASLTNDFSFVDTSISYAISARIIGRVHGYSNLLGAGNTNHNHDKDADEYVVANEDYKYIRVIPITQEIFSLNRSMIHQEARLLYSAMIDNIKDKINQGRDLSQHADALRPMTSTGSLATLRDEPINSIQTVMEDPNTLHPSSSTTELAKMQQSYYSKTNQTIRSVKNPEAYEVFYPIKKKSMFGSSKVTGIMVFSTPKKDYNVNYMSLPQFGTRTPTILSIPFDIVYIDDKHSPPEFKSVSVELVSLTIKSKKHPIPVVIHPEMLFENKNKGTSSSQDNFDVITIKRFQKYAFELSKLLKELGPELNVEREMVQDIKCLANLSTKYVHLKVKNLTFNKFQSINQIPWDKKIEQSSNGNEKFEDIKYVKKFDLNVDFGSLQLRPTLSDFCLVPDFQSCLIGRLYYLKIDIRLHTAEKISLRVPIVLQKT